MKEFTKEAIDTQSFNEEDSEENSEEDSEEDSEENGKEDIKLFKQCSTVDKIFLLLLMKKFPQAATEISSHDNKTNPASIFKQITLAHNSALSCWRSFLTNKTLNQYMTRENLHIMIKICFQIFTLTDQKDFILFLAENETYCRILNHNFFISYIHYPELKNYIIDHADFLTQVDYSHLEIFIDSCSTQEQNSIIEQIKAFTLNEDEPLQKRSIVSLQWMQQILLGSKTHVENFRKRNGYSYY